MKKQLLLLVMMLLPLVASAHDLEIRNADGVTIYYNYINNDTELAVTYNSYNYKADPLRYRGNVVIPEEVTRMNKTLKVTSIESNAFHDCKGLTSITIPKSITSIGVDAFRDCYNLTSVHISDLEAWCKISFESLANPLYDAHHLFLNGEEIKDLVIPNSITTIGSYAFDGCSGLNSVTIPNCVTKIGYYAFNGCTGLTSVHISDLEAWCKISFESLANPLYDAHHLFLNGEEIKDLVIPNSITTIGNYAFWGCSDLNSITIPNSVTTIGEHAFQFCNGLSSITIPDNVTTIGSNAFSGCSNLISITIGNGLTSIEASVFSSCSSLTSITIPDNVTSIGNYAFAYCSKLTSISIPEGVTIIGSGAFRECSSLTSVILGKGITSIGWSAFASCQELTDVYSLAETVPSTNSDAFNGSYDNAMLHVPEASMEVYSSKKPWMNFKGIVKIMPMYILTYIIDGNTYKLYQVEEGTTINIEANPMKEGYTFSGWSDIPETMPSNDVKVTGSFSINSYKLTYLVDGEEYKTIEVEYNSSITPEAEPTKEGHTFSGWSEIPKTMPAHDVTVTGTFKLDTGITQTVSDDNNGTTIFNFDGRRVDNTKKGLKIIRTKDGTTRKVVLK